MAAKNALSTKKPMGWGPVLATTALAAADVASTPVMAPTGPLAFTELATVPLALYTWTKKLDSYEGSGWTPSQYRKNPLPLVFIGVPLIGMGAIGMTAYLGAKHYLKQTRDEIHDQVEAHPLYQLSRPPLVAASFAAVAHARRQSPWKAALAGWAIGYAVNMLVEKTLRASYWRQEAEEIL